MTRNMEQYCQKKAAAALEKEFGFAPARLNMIVPLKTDDHYFTIHFRIGEHYYTCCNGKIERTAGPAGNE